MKSTMKDCEYEPKKGPQIGPAGSTRTAYETLGDKSYVIKVINAGIPATNFLEWFIWCGIKHSKYRDKFAACVSISETGKYLVMERLDPLEPSDSAALKALDVPTWLNDKLPHNFGKAADGAIKCLDYGMVDFETLLNLGEAGFDYFSVNQ